MDEPRVLEADCPAGAQFGRPAQARVPGSGSFEQANYAGHESRSQPEHAA
jgi:hypothetical protein